MERGVIVSLPFFEFPIRRYRINKVQEKISQALVVLCLGDFILGKC